MVQLALHCEQIQIKTCCNQGSELGSNWTTWCVRSQVKATGWRTFHRSHFSLTLNNPCLSRLWSNVRAHVHFSTSKPEKTQSTTGAMATQWYRTTVANSFCRSWTSLNWRTSRRRRQWPTFCMWMGSSFPLKIIVSFFQRGFIGYWHWRFSLYYLFC